MAENGASRSHIREAPVRSQEGGGNGLCPKVPQFSYRHALSLPRLYTLAKATELLSRQEAFQGGATGSPDGEAIAFPQADGCMEGRAPPKKGSICSVGEGFSTEILVAVPSVLSPEPQTPDSPLMALLCSTLLPRENGCK